MGNHLLKTITKLSIAAKAVLVMYVFFHRSCMLIEAFQSYLINISIAYIPCTVFTAKEGMALTCV
jgi:hypothetical protein